MSYQPSQQTPVASALAAALTVSESRPILLTVDQMSARNPAFTPPSLRNLIFKAETRRSTNGTIPGNGLIEAGAVLRIGRKVLIDEDRFLEWVRQQAWERK